ELQGPEAVGTEPERALRRARMPDDVIASFANDDAHDLSGRARCEPSDDARRDFDHDTDTRSAQQRRCFGDLVLGSERLGVITDRTQVGYCTPCAEKYQFHAFLG